MLPNHAPLLIAEQFGTLASFFPGRIDLGIGRAPGGDHRTARALRRHLGSADTFEQDLEELRGYFRPGGPGDGVNAVAADTDAEARRLFPSVQQAFLNLVRGTPGLPPPPVDSMDGLWTPAE